jgi:hypothetical protein
MGRIFTFLVGLVVGAVGLYLLVLSGNSSYSPPSAASQGLAPKLLAIAFAQDRASRTGQAVAVKESFSDDEISLMANEYLRQQDRLPLDHMALHSTSAGAIAGKATAHVAALNFGVDLTFHARVNNRNQVALEVGKVGIAGVPVPDQVSTVLTRSLLGSDLALPLGNLRDVSVNVGDGRLTVSGNAVPPP